MVRFVANFFNYISLDKTGLCFKYESGEAPLSVLNLSILPASVHLQEW